MLAAKWTNTTIWIPCPLNNAPEFDKTQQSSYITLKNMLFIENNANQPTKTKQVFRTEPV